MNFLHGVQLNYVAPFKKTLLRYIGFAGKSAEKTGREERITDLAVKNGSQEIRIAKGLKDITRFYENTFDFIGQ